MNYRFRSKREAKRGKERGTSPANVNAGDLENLPRPVEEQQCRTYQGRKAP